MAENYAESKNKWEIKEKIPNVPDFGWRVKLSHKCKVKCSAFQIPSLSLALPLIPFELRYIRFWIKKVWREKKQPFIDHFDLVPHKSIYGVPIGGIGCGTIGRGYQGEFCRFQMIPGRYKYNVVEGDQFIVNIRKRGQTVYQQVLSPFRPKGHGLNSWNWAFSREHATYHGLYPRAWTVYELPGQNVTLTCRQISPVIPHNYKDSCLPVAVFVWDIVNKNDEPVEVSIVFSFQSGQGEKADKQGGFWNEPFRTTQEKTNVAGVMIHQKFAGMDCAYAVSGKEREDVDVSYRVAFNPKTPAQEVWSDLMHDGRLDSSTESSKPTKKGEEIATAVCAHCKVEARSSNYVELCLSWDMPIINFRAKETLYRKRYTRWFGDNGDASPKLASYALGNYHHWEKDIDDWQRPVLENKNLPAWYKSALFNELYFVSDGGTVWLDALDGETLPGQEKLPEEMKDLGKFAYLEGHEYRMYNTYDVHHYASFALIMLWPKLQLSIQYDMANVIKSEDRSRTKFLMPNKHGVLKAMDTVPHDIGDPEDEPWSRVNAYCIHPTHDWKDLNPKFVLQVFRDYVFTKDKNYLKDMYPVAKTVMEYSMRWDTDGDGIIDNGGFADQTYDAWTVTGASAYCGGMWLGALKCMQEMSAILGKDEDTEEFTKKLEKGKSSYEAKLWNGSYYNYDSSASSYYDSVMSDQLCGHWFLKSSFVPDNSVFPKDNIRTALKTIFDVCVMPFRNGTVGAINGMRPNKKKDLTSVQSDEFWTGVTYGLGATMIMEGMVEEGLQTAYGAYHTIYENYGLQFQTPEAYNEKNVYRSLGYMRPLAIWSIQHALEKFQPQLFEK